VWVRSVVGSLRVALVMGSDRGGAEKQVAYAARALCVEGVKVGVFSVTRTVIARR
jgi:predicted dinucleotide-binding enzyme